MGKEIMHQVTTGFVQVVAAANDGDAVRVEQMIEHEGSLL